jgi:lipopolysaccharide export system permease protein
MILSLYLMRAYVMRFAGILIGLVFFLQALDLLSQANEVLKGGGATFPSLFRYMLLRLPAIIETVAPLAGLLGALTALVTMARNSEILAMRAAGRSVFSLIGGLVLVGAVLAVILFFFSNYVSTRTNATLEMWKAAGYRPDGQVRNEEASWIMDDTTMIEIGHVLRDGTVLNDVRLFRQAPEGGVVDIVDIRLAVWEDGHWSTFEVSRIPNDTSITTPGATDEEATTQQGAIQDTSNVGNANAADASATQYAPAPGNLDQITPVWHTELRPEHFLRYANHPNALSINALAEYIGPDAVGSRPGYFYDTWLHQKIAGPIILAIMPLLGAIAAFSHHRQGTAVLTLIWGVTLGFLFVVIDNVLLAMGQFGSLPPVLAAWMPLIFFTTVGIWIVFRFEHTSAHT